MWNSTWCDKEGILRGGEGGSVSKLINASKGHPVNDSVMVVGVAAAENTIQQMWPEHQADASKVGRKTYQGISGALKRRNYFQQTRHATNPNSPAYHRLSSQIYGQPPSISARHDLNPYNPTKLPICEDVDDNKLWNDKLVESILVYLIEELEMPRNKEKHVKIWSFLWGPNAGLGEHAGKKKRIP